MVYVYRKVVANRSYYYLRASERKGKKVLTKDLAYLGPNIEEVKLALKSLPEYSNEIKKAYKSINRVLESNHYLELAKKLKVKQSSYLKKDLQLELEACKLHWQKVALKRDKHTFNQYIKQFVIEFAFNTTSIEGNTITLKQAADLLLEHRVPKNKTLREVYDLQNTESVFLELMGRSKSLSEKLVINTHTKLMERIDPRVGYRTADVHVFRARFEATPTHYVKADMSLLMKWYKKFSSKLHPFVLATLFHHKFEKVHPFFDGNGRTGRMVMNSIILAHKYPPFIVQNKHRP
ncbi:MAG: Fic family protein, partial [Candidatus Nanoarchaeia archaeon]